jgi:electron transfer flavoprotein beta subunit
MNIVVPIKQVPETSNVKMDPETGTIIRAGVESVVNPLDLYALEAALRIREESGGTVKAVTMGPPQASRVLKEAIAMGCDEGALVSDRAFGGADTFATSYTLSAAIREMGPFDLIVTGERATDGDTAQVGPGIAAWLGIPALTYISKIESIEGGAMTLLRLIEEGYQRVKVRLPCMVSVLKEIAQPRLPTLRGKIASMEKEILQYNSGSLDLVPERLGLKGSPTRVTKIANAKVARNGRTLTVTDDASLEAVVCEVADFLEAKGAL